MRPHAILAKGLSMAIALALTAAPALGEDEPASPSPPGLPEALDWSFDFSAGLGAFGFNNSLYTNPRA